MKTQKMNEAFVRVVLENRSRDESIQFIASAISHRDEQIRLLGELRKPYMGQIMAECDCTNAACEQRGYCIADRIKELEARLEKAMGALDDLISTYVWVREDEYERGWSEMSNAVHEATFVQMELKDTK